MTGLLVALLAASVLGNVAQYIAAMRERRWWANRVIARHAPDITVLERKPSKPKPDGSNNHPVMSQRID